MFKNLLNLIINETLNEVLRNFNFNFFKSLPWTKQEKYAQKHLPYIGKGSSRIVFALSGNKALKIAKNEKGNAQNEVEVSVYSNPITKNVVTKIYDFDHKDYSWIIAELAKPFNSYGTFEQVLGISLEELYELVSNNDSIENIINNIQIMLDSEKSKQQNTVNLSNPPKIKIKFLEKKLSKILNSISKIKELVDGIKPLVNKLNISANDLNAIEQIGLTSDNRIVIIDYGFDDYVSKTHYYGRF